MNQLSYEYFTKTTIPIIINTGIFILILVIIFNLVYFYKLKKDFKQFKNNKKLFFLLLISGVIALIFLLFLFTILVKEKLNYNPQDYIQGLKKLSGEKI